MQNCYKRTGPNLDEFYVVFFLSNQQRAIARGHLNGKLKVDTSRDILISFIHLIKN